MAFEVDKTALIQFITRDDEVHHKHVITLPKCVIFVRDPINDYAQLIIKFAKEEEANLFKGKDVGYIALLITNDAYADFTHPIINLGYHVLNWTADCGFIEVNKDEVVYTTYDSQESKMKVNFPLKFWPYKQMSPQWLLEYIPFSNMYQLVDIRFDENTTRDIHVRHLKWISKERHGAFIHYITNVQSIQNGHTKIENVEFENLDIGLDTYQKSKDVTTE